jgi:hypothetical protein
LYCLSFTYRALLHYILGQPICGLGLWKAGTVKRICTKNRSQASKAHFSTVQPRDRKRKAAESKQERYKRANIDPALSSWHQSNDSSPCDLSDPPRLVTGSKVLDAVVNKTSIQLESACTDTCYNIVALQASVLCAEKSTEVLGDVSGTSQNRNCTSANTVEKQVALSSLTQCAGKERAILRAKVPCACINSRQ